MNATRPRWRIEKRPADWSDHEHRWTVLYDAPETLDQNSDAASIEDGQFDSHADAVKAFWQAWWDQYSRCQEAAAAGKEVAEAVKDGRISLEVAGDAWLAYANRSYRLGESFHRAFGTTLRPVR